MERQARSRVQTDASVKAHLPPIPPGIKLNTLLLAGRWWHWPGCSRSPSRALVCCACRLYSFWVCMSPVRGSIGY